jgi:hypothetical protein
MVEKPWSQELPPAITVIVLVGVLLAILLPYLWSIFWAYGDAERRGKSGCLVALLVALFSWPIGLLLWFVFRPEGPPERREV